MWITDKKGYRYLCEPSKITNVTPIQKTWLGDDVFTVFWVEATCWYWPFRTEQLVFTNDKEYQQYDAEIMRDKIIEAVNKAKEVK